MRGVNLSLNDRFWSKVQKSDGCWLWTASRGTAGYGYFVGLKSRQAHRVAWELTNGKPVPSGLMVCHTCDVRACVRPDHLFLGTAKDNAQDAVSKDRLYRNHPSHCVNGHQFTPENTRQEQRNGRVCRRRCLACCRDHSERYRRAQRIAAESLAAGTRV